MTALGPPRSEAQNRRGLRAKVDLNSITNGKVEFKGAARTAGTADGLVTGPVYVHLNLNKDHWRNMFPALTDERNKADKKLGFFELGKRAKVLQEHNEKYLAKLYDTLLTAPTSMPLKTNS